MQYIKNTPTSTLYWIQPRWGKPEYELRSDEELYCTLKWATNLVWSPVSIISADGQWTLIPQYGLVGWSVRVVSSDCEIAFSKVRWLGSRQTVEFVNGGKFYWRSHFCSAGWAFSGEGMGDLVICNGGRLPTEKLRVRVDLVQKAKDLPEVALLAGLGLFFWKTCTTGRRLGLVW